MKLVAASLICLLSGCSSSGTPESSRPSSTVEAGKTPDRLLAQLLKSMRQGTWDRFEFPKLEWSDVDALRRRRQ